MSSNLPPQLRRLAWIDERLATTGVCAIRDAKLLHTSAKTVRRALDLLHTISPLVYVDEIYGRRRWLYADRRRRVFSQWFAQEWGAKAARKSPRGTAS